MNTFGGSLAFAAITVQVYLACALQAFSAVDVEIRLLLFLWMLILGI